MGHFCPPGSGSGSTDPIESGSHTDTDPDPQPWVKYTYTEWLKIPPQEGGTSCAACLALFCDCRDFLAHKEEGSCPLAQHQAWIQALRQRHPTAEKRTSEPVKEGVEPNVLEAYVLDGLRIKEEFPIPVPSVTSYACAHKVSWSYSHFL